MTRWMPLGTTTAMILPILVMIIGVVAVLIPSFVTFDRIVKREAAEHPEAWAADGRPQGFFWKPAGGSGWAGNKCAMLWPLRTPAWAKGDEAALLLVRRLRRLVLLWNLVVVPLFVLAAIAPMWAQSGK